MSLSSVPSSTRGSLAPAAPVGPSAIVAAKRASPTPSPAAPSPAPKPEKKESKGAKKEAPKAAPLSLSSPAFPLPKSGENREEYRRKLQRIGCEVMTTAGGSHHMVVTPAGEKFTLALGGDRGEFGPDAAGRIKKGGRVKGAAR